MRWITACELGLRRRRLSSRKVICAVERERVLTFSSSIRTEFMSRSLQTTSSGRCPSTQPWRSLSSASAAESRCASAFASAFSAMALASAATRAASSQAPALRCATAASRSQIACAISSGANSRAPSRVAFWIRSSDCCSARSAAAICATGIAISIPGRTSETARSLARRISIQRSGSPRCCSARSRRLWPSSRTTTIGSSAALAVEPCHVSSDATITQTPEPSRAVLPTPSPPVSSLLRQNRLYVDFLAS